MNPGTCSGNQQKPRRLRTEPSSSRTQQPLLWPAGIIPLAPVHVSSTCAAASKSLRVPEPRSPAVTDRLPSGRLRMLGGARLQHDVATAWTGGARAPSVPPQSAGDQTRQDRADEPYRKRISRIFVVCSPVISSRDWFEGRGGRVGR